MQLIPTKWRRGGSSTEAERSYAATMMRIGIALLVFLFLFDTLWSISDVIADIFGVFLTEDGSAALADVLDSLAYLVSFMLPGLIFILITPRHERVPMLLTPTVSRGAGWLVLLGIAIISAMASINAKIVGVFGYGTYSSNVIWATSTIADYEGVLLFISTAIVPAFSEEFLFRGVICNSLRPYGKTVAILGSSVLFGLMHQNVGQLFYATMAGVVLAVAYLETKSIWTSVFIHMFNNLSSVVTDIVADRLDVTGTNRVLASIDAIIFGLGMLALLVLIRRGERAGAKGKSSDNLPGGRWDEETFSQSEIPADRLARKFFSPTVLLFTVISVYQTLKLLYYALRYVYKLW